MKEKIRIASVKLIVGISFFTLLACMVAFDSEVDLVPPILISIFFLASFVYSNVYWKGEKHE